MKYNVEKSDPMHFSPESVAHLEHSQPFLQLHQKFHQFNPFKVLRSDHYEIRHSNVLAWLLDPSENHHLGAVFIRQLLSRLATKPENEDNVQNVDILKFMYASFHDTKVFREVKTSTNRFIDIVTVTPSQKLVVVIENKYHANESDGQLNDYLRYIKDQYNGWTVVPVFLTLSSDEPSDSEYLVLDYNDIYEIITLQIQMQEDTMSSQISEFLMHYTDILSEQLIEDNEALDTGLSIFELHKEAIELLYFSHHYKKNKNQRYAKLAKYINELPSDTRESLQQIYTQKKKTIDYIFSVGNNVLREAFISFVKNEEIPAYFFKTHVTVPNFVQPEWDEYQEEIGKPEQGYWLGYGLIIWFERTWNEMLKITIELGPTPYEKRLGLLEGLDNYGIPIRSSAKEEGKKYTKIYTATEVVSDWASKQSIEIAMKSLYQSDKINQVFKGITYSINKESNKI